MTSKPEDKRDTWLGGCNQAREALKIPDTVNCCYSCHEDDEQYGYDLCTIQTDNGFYAVCCAVANAYKEPQ